MSLQEGMAVSEPGSSELQVVAGVIVDPSGQILIAKRHDHLHQGGLWEFPGGKIEFGETPAQALTRELAEEVGIQVLNASPLMVVRHDYPDRKICLHVWRVDCFAGEAVGLLGQPLRWVWPDDLPSYPFPDANRPVIAAARLPDRYALMDVPSGDLGEYHHRLAGYHEQGIRLVRLRAANLSAGVYSRLAHEVARWCRPLEIDLILDGDVDLVHQTGARGLHLRSDELMALDARPLDDSRWLAASCHNPLQLRQAADVGADFAVLSPVRVTATHPGVRPLGWDSFSSMVKAARLPVYALGGLSGGDLPVAKSCGAQGIAAIRGFEVGFAPL